ncbi:DUF6483 family protein [Alkaliphilus crotonatoxidans]
MHYQQDWIMRQIESVVVFIIRMILGKKSDPTMMEEFEQTTSQFNDLYIKLHGLVLKNKTKNR